MDSLDLFPSAGIRFISVQHEQNAAHMVRERASPASRGTHTRSSFLPLRREGGRGKTEPELTFSTCRIVHRPMATLAFPAVTASVSLKMAQVSALLDTPEEEKASKISLDFS